MVGISTLASLQQTPPPALPNSSSTLYLVVVRMARKVRKYPGWEGIAAGGRYDGGSFI